MTDLETRYPAKLREIREELSGVGLNLASPDLKDIIVLVSCLVLRGHATCLVLDNVDQLSHVSSEYQERALQLANSLTEKLKMITIITLREESVFRSSISGILDAIVPSVFHISSPSFETLIRYRIDYVLELLTKPDDEIVAATGAYDVCSKKETLGTLFEIVKDSLRSSRRRGREILEFINEISGGDMRVALHLFRTFLVSGNTDVEDMLKTDKFVREQGQPGYQIPFHHVIKSVILEHSRLYSSSRSRIMNVFSVNPEHTNSHFTHLRILNYLYNRRSHQTPDGRGFVEIDSVINEAEELMMNRDAIEDSLRQMAWFSLVEFENRSKKGYDSAAYVRITNTGIYYLEQLIFQFQYLDLVWMDTPISDPDTVDELVKFFVEFLPKSENHLRKRFYRTERFLEYLLPMEEREFRINPQYSGSIFAQKEFIPKIREAFLQQQEYILERRAQAQFKDTDLP